MRGVAQQWGLAGVVGVVLLACACSAQAATITVGSPMTIPIPEKSRVIFKSGLVTIANLALAAPGARATSPVSGTVVRWRMAANYLGGPYALRVLRLDSSGTFYWYGAISAPVWPTSGPQTITTNLPIQAGDLIALEVPATNGIPFLKIPGSRSGGYWVVPPMSEKDFWAPQFEDEEWEYGFNADVQPPPVLTTVSPTIGTVAGGTTVTMTGSDFEGTTAVKFGNTPAQSFAVNSGGQLTAVAPTSVQVSTVAVSVTTLAGTASLPSSFTYRGCVVPNVKGRKLRGAKKVIRAANCAMGHVDLRKSGRKKVGRILVQQPTAGTVTSPGSKVTVVRGIRLPGHRR